MLDWYCFPRFEWFFVVYIAVPTFFLRPYFLFVSCFRYFGCVKVFGGCMLKRRPLNVFNTSCAGVLSTFPGVRRIITLILPLNDSGRAFGVQHVQHRFSTRPHTSAVACIIGGPFQRYVAVSVPQCVYVHWCVTACIQTMPAWMNKSLRVVYNSGISSVVQHALIVQKCVFLTKEYFWIQLFSPDCLIQSGKKCWDPRFTVVCWMKFGRCSLDSILVLYRSEWSHFLNEFMPFLDSCCLCKLFLFWLLFAAL